MTENLCLTHVQRLHGVYFDLVVGPDGLKQGKDTSAWKSGRLVQAVKQLMFFAEIFPKKYQNEFTEALLK